MAVVLEIEEVLEEVCMLHLLLLLLVLEDLMKVAVFLVVEIIEDLKIHPVSCSSTVLFYKQ